MWRNVPDYEGYQASDDGRIRNRRRKLLKQRFADGGLRVDLGGRKASVHNLVAAAFFGSHRDYRPDHVSGDPTDNRTDNLWFVKREPKKRKKRQVGERCTHGHWLIGEDVRYWGAARHRICCACERGDPPNLEISEII